MQLSVMRDQLRLKIGKPTIGDVPDADLTTHINSAYIDIADKYRFHKARKRCTFPTVIGTARYGLPTDCLAVYGLRNVTNGGKLYKFGDGELGERLPGDAAQTTAAPSRYVTFRAYIELDPIPNAIYTLELFYKAGLVNLVLDADLPLIPLPWHTGIVLLARWYYYDGQKHDLPKAQYAWNSWKAWISNKPNEIDEEKRDIDSGVRVPTLTRGISSRLNWDQSP